MYGGVLPAETLAAVTDEDAAETLAAPPRAPRRRRHRVLVALEGDRVVGVAALAPAADPDTVPALDAELHALCVDPDEEGHGHGSRLVNASADVMRDDGFSHLHVWLGEPRAGLRAFLEGAGWDADGATRTLDLRGDGRSSSSRSGCGPRSRTRERRGRGAAEPAGVRCAPRWCAPGWASGSHRVRTASPSARSASRPA